MGVFKRAGSTTWHCEFVVDGERIRAATGATRKRDAETFERQLRQRIYEQRVLGGIEEMTLGVAAKRFDRTVMVPRGNEASAARDRYAIKRIVEGFGEHTLLSSITARQIARFRDDLLDEGKKPATANRYLAILRSILNTAKREWGALAVVPAIKLLPLNNKRYRFLSQEEEARLLPVCSPHLRDLVIFLLDTGARKSEAFTPKEEAPEPVTVKELTASTRRHHQGVNPRQPSHRGGVGIEAGERECPGSPEQHLWLSVIRQAFEDATGRKVAFARPGAEAERIREEARHWFAGNGHDFRETCHLAGLDPDAVRARALKLFKTVTDAPAPRRTRASGVSRFMGRLFATTALTPLVIVRSEAAGKVIRRGSHYAPGYPAPLSPTPNPGPSRP